MIRKLVREAFTKKVTIQGKYKKHIVKIPPSQALVQGVTVAILFFFGLLGLEVFYIVWFGKVEPVILNTLQLIASLVIGAFFGSKT